MNKQRLEHLCDNILAKVKPSQFDIHNWKCETAACAVGHACFNKHFNEEGLKFEKSEFYLSCPMYRGMIYFRGAYYFWDEDDAKS